MGKGKENGSEKGGKDFGSLYLRMFLISWEEGRLGV
jgi:hypothetical protein